jgi:hypothetical protein
MGNFRELSFKSVLALQIAQNMGLSRLGPEPTDPNVTAETISKRFGSRWVSAIDREVGRRVWANLVGTSLSVRRDGAVLMSLAMILDPTGRTRHHLFH